MSMIAVSGLALSISPLQNYPAHAEELASLKDAASTAARGMLKYYHGNEPGKTPGTLEGTWWEAGAMFMTLVQYWRVSGDSSHNDLTTQGLQWQSGDDHDYLPANSSAYLGNDDQMFWGLAAMTCAETKYPDVSDGPSWLSLVQGVFNNQIPRWEMQTCHGGLRWQIHSWLPGYDLKNTISNGGLFQIAARLARYTGDQKYADWATKIWDWMASSPLLDTKTWNVADTTSVTNDCKTNGNEQWTYNYGTLLSGAAYMYNLTNGDPKWLDAVDGLLNASLRIFFPPMYNNGTVLSEVSCETIETCDRNQMCFKGFLSIWMAYTATLVPSTAERIIPRLQGSAEAAARQCSGGQSGTECGVRWYEDKWDGKNGLETQMSSLSIFTANLMLQSNEQPVTSSTGGESKSDPNAGTGGKSKNPESPRKITTGDRAGAWIITLVVGIACIAIIVWLVWE
ncbi:glycoside hydrolase [Aspergillus pseudotamarii]|uniref:Mannan endo-1,6-alpha-mannosidase n=1 Tax=Aspergillus pseudotamarii TaxID=132259 RepID=A0A5N6T072_ASPPS|nr:glycoside hydrolase [Aspergillus pseudotamarii]KAE8139471.1 glycoside hydrolase [Aspergillus pseudotamarii]